MAVPHGTRVHPAQPTQRAEHGDPQGDVRVRLHRHEVQHGAAIAQRVPGLQRTGREQTKGKTPLSGRWAAGRTGPLRRIWPRGAGTSPRRSPRTRGHEPEPGPLPRAMLLADEGAPPGAGAAGETAVGSCTAPREPAATFQGCHETTSVAVPNQCSLLGPHVSAPNVGSDAPAHACPSAADSPPPERGPSSTLGKYLRDLLKDSELC